MVDDGSVRGRKGRRLFLWGILILLLLALAGYALGGFVLLPRLAKQELGRFVTENLHRELRVQRIRVNPFTLRFDLEDVALVEPDGATLVSFQHLTGDIDFRRLLDRELVIERLLLRGPWVHLAIDREGVSNFARLADDIAALGNGDRKEGAEGKAAMPVTLRLLRVDNGQLRISDRRGRWTARIDLLPIDFTLRDVSTAPGREGPMRLSVRLAGGGSLLWEGKLSLEPLASEGRLQVRRLVPHRAWAFLEEALAIEEPAGSIDLDADYRFAIEEGEPRLQVDGVRLALKGLVITRRGGDRPLITLSEIALDDGSYRLDGNRVRIGRLRIGDGSVRVVRNHTLLNWQQIITRAEASAAGAPPADEGPALPWSLALKELLVEEVAVEFEDRDQRIPFRVGASLDLQLSARAGHDGERLHAGAEGLRLRLTGLSLQQEGAKGPLLRLDEAVLDGGSADLNRQRVTLGELTLKGGGTRVVRRRDGGLEWARLWQPTGTAAGASAERTQPPAARAPWEVTLERIALAGFRVDVRDAVPEQPLKLRLDPVELRVTGAGTDLQRPLGFQLQATLEQGGRIAASGELVPATQALTAEVELTDLALTPLQSYLQPLARVALQSGRASFSGRLKREPPALTLEGTAQVDDLRVTETDTGEVLLGWKIMRAPGLALGLAPDRLAIDEILLDRPVGRFIIAEDQSNNWQRLLKDSGEAPSGEKEDGDSGTPFPYRIGRIAIDQGGLDFADLSLPLEFATRMHGLEGAVTGLSNEPGSRTAVDLKGRVDEYGGAAIAGEVDLADPTAMTDIGLSFRNLEMTRLTPYTVKFLGYRMASGKLSVDLKYRIQERRLQGDNRIVLERLELGEKMESPEAIDAPLELAIALLEDGNGRIDLGVPVKGGLDDPEFSYGHLIWQAVGNLLTGIVTAPFRALGAALGAKGEDLDNLVFAPAEATLPPPEEEKLKTVAQLLTERPRLVLMVIPRYDPKRDDEALKRRALQAAVLRKMGVKVEPGRRLDPISLADRRVRQALEALYAERFSTARLAAERQALKPSRDKAGKERPGIGEEVLYRRLFDALLAAERLPQDALQALARQRGEAILNRLIGADGLPPERVRLEPPVALEETGEGDVVATRLDLTAG